MHIDRSLMPFLPQSVRALLLVSALILAGGAASAQPGHIYIDEDFGDWVGIDPLYQANGGTFFQRLSVTNDADYLYLYLEIIDEEILQESDITLWIDTDSDAATGISVGDLGAELRWIFGARSGTFVQGGSQTTIRHAHIGVVNAPTVSSSRFEIAIRRDARPDGQNLLFGSDGIRILLNRTSGGPALPGSNTGLAYTFQEIERERPPVSLARHQDAHLRVVAYNSERDAIFDPQRRPAYDRIFPAILPDLIGFTEIYVGTAEQVKAVMDEILPIEGGWHAAKVFHDGAGGGNDIVLASRYPILDAVPIVFRDNRGTRTGAFTVDLRPHFDTDLMVFVSHPNCCQSDLLRQEQLDAKMAFLREWKDAPTTEPGTPFMHIGDMNLVTFESQRRTLLYGEIVNYDFMPSFAPDWDGSSLRDLKPPVTGAPMTFTWYSESSAFSPGRLDYIIYSGSTLESLNGFSLFTPTLRPEELDHYGLLADDTILASDHLPLIGDFRLQLETSTTGPLPKTHLDVGSAYPNPSAGTIDLPVTLSKHEDLTIEIIDVLGRRLWSERHSLEAGAHVLRANIGDVAAGLYLVRVSNGSGAEVQRITVAR
jgi:hypothetical protein